MFQTTVSFSCSRWPATRGATPARNASARTVLKTSSASAEVGLGLFDDAAERLERRGAARRPPARTRGSTGRPPRSVAPGDPHALEVALERRGEAAARLGDGDRRRGSGPAIALSISATSATVRAIGPSTVSVDQPVCVGHAGTRPGDGRSPTTLQKLAGLRSEPPMSLPSASGTMPQASATAAPPLLPPQVLVGS